MMILVFCPVLFQDIHGLVTHEFEVHRPGKSIEVYTVKCGDEGFKAALVRGSPVRMIN